MFTDADVIYEITRDDLLADGSLIDVTELAAEAGFRVPVAITCGVEWYVTPTATEAATDCQDRTGRLWDVLNLARITGLAGRQDFYVLMRIRGRREAGGLRRVHMRVTVGPMSYADQRPAVTILLRGED